jgi:prepilin-type N-terminal cleavage/methylation domain-containing protein
MSRTRRGHEQGFTLLELTLAVAVFAVVLGATAQVLVSHYATLDLQQQRSTAVQLCRGVLSDMRAARDANPDDFPGAITEMWPNDVQVDGTGLLRNEQVTVNYADSTANPLNVRVTVSWSDLRGRPVRSSLATMLTDQ